MSNQKFKDKLVKLANINSEWAKTHLEVIGFERQNYNDVIPAEESSLYDEEFSFQDHEDETVGPKTGYEY